MAQRIVSLVPSLTEAIAVTLPGRLVGATDWCSHPADLDVARIGGTKNPDTDKVLALAPDLVVANAEENRPVDIARLRDLGLDVFVMYPKTVPEALLSLSDMLTACGATTDPAWLELARREWLDDRDFAPIQVAVPIWRRPWMVLGCNTFAGDVLARCGGFNTFAEVGEHYPKTSPSDIADSKPDLIVFPDEPYAFSPADGPEAFAGIPATFISGRDLTWYGPSLVGARQRIRQALERPAKAPI